MAQTNFTVSNSTNLLLNAIADLRKVSEKVSDAAVEMWGEEQEKNITNSYYEAAIALEDKIIELIGNNIIENLGVKDETKI